MPKPKTPHVTKATKYIKDVLSGRIDVCGYVKDACRRQQNDLKRQGKRGFPYHFDAAKAERACKFIELMPHTKGEWLLKKETLKLELWQCFLVTTLFGWVDNDGNRRFTETYWEIPRKNGKSPKAAAIGNYMFSADGEPGAEVYAGATTEKQAWEVFKPAKIMTEKAVGYKEKYGISVNAKNLSIIADGSKFEPVIGKPGDGASVHCGIVDEFHEHPTPDLYDCYQTGMAARRSPITLIITTSGTNTAGPCYQKRDYAIKILKGILKNESIFAVIYTIDKDDDWTDFKVWRKANPNFGVSVKERFLKAQLLKAKQQTSSQNIIRCKHLNEWMNAGTAWINIVEWGKCANPKLTINDVKDLPCFIGIDLASKIDICAMMMVFRGDDRFYTFGRYYLPYDTVWRDGNDHYQTWADDGMITVTDGSRTDYAAIEDDIRGLTEQGIKVHEIAFDPHEASYLVQNLMEEYGEDKMIEISQGPAHISEPMKELEAVYMSQKIEFDGDPVLTWMMSNVICKPARKYFYPTKDSPEKKIDAAVALIMAMSRAIVHDESEGDSVYDERGVLSI